MLIKMRQDAGKILARRIFEHFKSQGFKIFVENGGKQISLAVFNSENDLSDYFQTEGLVGIATILSGNRYFVEHRKKFVSATEYFPD